MGVDCAVGASVGCGEGIGVGVKSQVVIGGGIGVVVVLGVWPYSIAGGKSSVTPPLPSEPKVGMLLGTAAWVAIGVGVELPMGVGVGLTVGITGCGVSTTTRTSSAVVVLEASVTTKANLKVASSASPSGTVNTGDAVSTPLNATLGPPVCVQA